MPQAPRPPSERHRIVPSQTAASSPGVSSRRSTMRPRTPRVSTRARKVRSQALSRSMQTDWQTRVGWVRLAKVTTSTVAPPPGSSTRNRVVSSPVEKSYAWSVGDAAPATSLAHSPSRAISPASG